MTNLLNTSIVREYEGLFSEDFDALAVQPVGLSVEDVEDLRNQLRDANLSMQLLRNRPAKRVLGDVGFASVDDLFAGPVAVIFAPPDQSIDAPAIIAAKVVSAWRKKNKQELPSIKGGFMDRRFLTMEEAEGLKRIPSREELLSILAGQIVSPGRTLAAQITAPAQRLASQIESHKDTLD